MIICGPSDYGAIRGILHPETVAGMPAVARWLRYGDEARRQLGLSAAGADEDGRLAHLTELNVLVQMEHLASHLAVQQAQSEGRLALHSWVYEIEPGEVRAYDPAHGGFVPFPDA